MRYSELVYIINEVSIFQQDKAWLYYFSSYSPSIALHQHTPEDLDKGSLREIPDGLTCSMLSTGECIDTKSFDDFL